MGDTEQSCGQWKMWRGQQVWEMPGHPRDVLGMNQQALEMGPENSGEKTGLEEAASEASKEEEASLL